MLDMYSRAEVVRFLGSVPTPMTGLEQAKARIERARATNERERLAGSPCGWWAVEVSATGVVAGTVAVLHVDGDDESPVEVAWHLHPDAQGRGYATEAAGEAFEHAHRSGLAEVLALTDEANTASQAVCRRLGLALVEVSDRFYGKPLQVWASRR
jgi:RimJ/RimL family protein N-acetyltransferase